MTVLDKTLAAQLARHAQLRYALGRLMSGISFVKSAAPGGSLDVVVTAMEMNEKHGTGALVKRVFAGCRGIVSVRSRDDYGGDHSFGEVSVVLPHAGLSRAESIRTVLQTFDGRAVGRVACVPFSSDELVTCIVLADELDARYAVWIMDDQNVATRGIPDALMREALEKASLRLTTHPEMRQAYEKKYGLPFFLLPAVVPGALVTTRTSVPSPRKGTESVGALVGSLWAREWFDLLSRTLGPSGFQVDWYGNHQSPYLRLTRDDLATARIRACGILPEPKLAEALRQLAFAIVPTGTLDDAKEETRALAELSLPGRILFVAATSNTPVIVLGSERTSAARFVRRFDIGLCVPYDARAFRRAVEEIMRPEIDARMRANAIRIAPALSGEGIGSWLWASLERGEPIDDRFEALLPRGAGDPVPTMPRPAEHTAPCAVLSQSKEA